MEGDPVEETASPTDTSNNPNNSGTKKTPRTISRRACDACRLRKVKCEPLDDAEVIPATPVSLEHNGSRKRPREAEDRPCKACAALPIECTRNMPVKRRGPPNRLAQQAKLLSQSPSLSTNNTPHAFGTEPLEIQQEYLPPPTSSPLEKHSTQPFTLYRGEATSYPRSNGVASIPRNYSPSGKTESVMSERDPITLLMGSFMPFEDGSFDTSVICSRRLFDRIMNDYIHILQPITPVVHIPTFRADLQRQRQSFDATFFSLTISIIAYTVGALPRKFQEYHSFDPSLRFRARKEMIHFCDKLINLTKPDDYYNNLTHEKWAIHCLIGLSFTHLGMLDRYAIDFGQSGSIAEKLGFHKISTYRDLDCIEAQLRKKAFWLDYYAKVHSRIIKDRWPSLSDRLYYETVDADQLWPIEVDDEYITRTEILQQPPGRPSLTIGFNANSRIFCCLVPASKDPSVPILTTTSQLPTHSSRLDENYLSTCTCGTFIQLAPQHAVVYALLDKVRYVVDDLPPELQPWRDDVTSIPPTATHPHASSSHSAIRNAQFEAMRANIHATHLWAQSVLTERLISLNHPHSSNSTMGMAMTTSPHHHNHQQSVPISESSAKYIWSLREEICQSLLRVLYNIRQSNLEPNGGVLVYKIRQVASTLLDCPFEERSDIAQRASDYISEFVGLLARVDGNGTSEVEVGLQGSGSGDAGAGGTMSAMEGSEYWNSIDSLPRSWYTAFGGGSGGMAGIDPANPGSFDNGRTGGVGGGGILGR